MKTRQSKGAEAAKQARPKEGRVGKTHAKRATSRVAKKTVKIEVKKQLQSDLEKTKEMSREIRAIDKAEKVAKHERAKANKVKKEENTKKTLLAQNKKNMGKAVKKPARRGGKKPPAKK